MASSYNLVLNGQQADPTLYAVITSVEVEESMDLPAAVQITLPVSRDSGGDLTYVSDLRFAPLATVAVVATAGASGASGVASGATPGDGSAPVATQCIFDGYVLAQKVHLETGITNASICVWGQDASWLMNQTEKVKEWVDVTDSKVAASIFGDYNITPSDQNDADDSPSHTADTHSLMQRGSDIAFLRLLARRTGKVCRIACADQPGARTGFFARPKLDGAPAVTIRLNDPTNWTAGKLDLEWDATRPTAVVARTALFSDNDSSGVNGDTSDSGLLALGGRGLGDFTGKPTTVLLAAAVDSAGELAQRARAVLRETGWFARCEAEVDVERLGVVLRAGMLVALTGIGAVFSGTWIVWTIRHRITREAHNMTITLLRNAVGDAPAGGAGGLGAMVGSA